MSADIARASRRNLLTFMAQSPLVCGLGGSFLASEALGQDLPQMAADGLRLEGLIKTPAEALNVFDFEPVMRSRINPGHWAYMAQGSDDMGTMAANRAGFAKIGLRPKRLVDVTNIDMSVELFGQRYAAPVLLAPVGAQGAFHAEGEVAVARAAKARNAGQILSTVTNNSVEDVASARGAPIFYQLYATSDWNITGPMVKRAEAAGCPALVFTVDLPARNLEPIARFDREGSTFCGACHDDDPAASWRTKPMFEGVDVNTMRMSVAGLTWDYIDRLKDSTSMKVLVKGIVTAEDAQRCLEHGADGIVVSNHGGRADETLVASIDSLAEVLAAVDGRVPVLCDSGFRRGTDVFKALALGASAVCIGRPYLWGLGAFGQEGVERVLDILARELRIVMQQMGTTRIAEIDRTSLRI
jgi:isopentenyl diphosphate isomerase/L-lactate dehydrogenase-like FMN-dependent dehydrogenase